MTSRPFLSFFLSFFLFFLQTENLNKNPSLKKSYIFSPGERAKPEADRSSSLCAKANTLDAEHFTKTAGNEVRFEGLSCWQP
jgi:hypothetical protein